jgi:hypothetical protein
MTGLAEARRWHTVAGSLVEGDPARRRLGARFHEARAFVEGLSRRGAAWSGPSAR